jgi:hypothetical protein
MQTYGRRVRLVSTDPVLPIVHGIRPDPDD